MTKMKPKLYKTRMFSLFDKLTSKDIDIIDALLPVRIGYSLTCAEHCTV